MTMGPSSGTVTPDARTIFENFPLTMSIRRGDVFFPGLLQSGPDSCSATPGVSCVVRIDQRSSSRSTMTSFTISRYCLGTPLDYLIFFSENTQILILQLSHGRSIDHSASIGLAFVQDMTLHLAGDRCPHEGAHDSQCRRTGLLDLGRPTGLGIGCQQGLSRII